MGAVVVVVCMSRAVATRIVLPRFALLLVLLAVARVAKSHGTVAALVRFDTSVHTLVPAQIGRA